MEWDGTRRGQCDMTAGHRVDHQIQIHGTSSRTAIIFWSSLPGDECWVEEVKTQCLTESGRGGGGDSLRRGLF